MSMPSEMPDRDATKLSLTDVEKRRLGRIYRFCLRKLTQTAAAMLGYFHIADGEDVVHDAHISFSRRAMRGGLKCLGYRRIADIEDDELDQYLVGCCRYLTRIVARKCYDCRRTAKSRSRADAGWFRIVREAADPNIDVIRLEQIDRVRRATKRLPKRLHKVWVLRFQQQCSEEEIAAVLGISVRTVQRCLDKLLQQMCIELLTERAKNRCCSRR